MKIVITGACGHIGSFLVENLNKIKNVKKVILIDNMRTNKFNSLFKLKKKPNFSFYQKDLSIKNSLINFKNVDIIIHCASMTDAANSFATKKLMYKNNLGCMKTVLDYCIKNRTKLIHISTTSVYGKQANIVTENDHHLLKPQSPYADIKLIEEKLLLKNTKKIKFNSFRFGTIAGVSRGMRFHTAINKFCLNAGLNKDITVYQTAYNQYRPYLTLRDSFKVFRFCIENNFFKNEIFNALSGNFTVKQIVDKIKKYKKNVKIKYIKSPIMNQLTYHVSPLKLKKSGLILKTDISKDIRDTLSLFKNIHNDEM